MIVVYSKCRRLRERLRPILPGDEIVWTEAWDEFAAAPRSVAEVGVYCTPDYAAEDSARLRSVFGASVGGPSCVVVTPLSLRRLQLLRELDSSSFQAVWAEEAADRLPSALRRAGWRSGPLQMLAHRILACAELRPQVDKALRIACGLGRQNLPPPPPIM